MTTYNVELDGKVISSVQAYLPEVALRRAQAVFGPNVIVSRP